MLLKSLSRSCFLSPFDASGSLAFWINTIFMLGIMATGNYNFFNFVTIVISLPLLIDSDQSAFSAGVFQSRIGRRVSRLIRTLLALAILAVMTLYTIRLFKLRVVDGIVTSKTGFAKDDLYRELAYAVPLLIVIGILLFASEVVTALIRCFSDFRTRYCRLQFWTLLHAVAICAVAAGIFAASLVPFSWLDRGAYDMLWPQVKEIHTITEPYHVTSSYGLFRSMTGVGGRPELIIEGGPSEEGPWKEYEFIYKPGSLERPLPVLIPHQPRIDWQMWFAALSDYKNNPWFLSLVHRLLRGQDEVLHLLEHNPFPDSPPKFIRASLYTYHYTSSNPKNKHFSTTNWWWRESQKEYLPPVSLENPSLDKVLNKHNFIVEKPNSEPMTPLSQAVQMARSQVNKIDGHEFVWGVTVAVIVVRFTRRLIF